MQSDEALAMALAAAVGRLAREISNGQLPGLSVTEMAILNDLDTQPGITPGELAARERMRPPSVTRHIQELAGRKLIMLDPNPCDQRSILLSVTDEGRQVLAAAWESAWLVLRIAELPPGSRRALADVIPVLDRLHRGGFPAGKLARVTNDFVILSAGTVRSP